MSGGLRHRRGLSLLEVLLSLVIFASVTIACGPILASAGRNDRLTPAPVPADVVRLADRCRAAASEQWISQLADGPAAWSDPEHPELGSLVVILHEQPSGVDDRTLTWLVMRQDEFTVLRLWAITPPNLEDGP